MNHISVTFWFLKPGFHVTAPIAQITQNRSQTICVILWNFADDWGDHTNHSCLERTMFHHGNNDHDNCSTSKQTYILHFWENRLHFYSCCMWSDQKHSITFCRATVIIMRNSQFVWLHEGVSVLWLLSDLTLHL